MSTVRLLAVLGLLGWVGELVCAPVSPVVPLKRDAPPWGSGTFEFAFEANKRACAIVIGRGPPNPKGGEVLSSFLGMYVYDAHGNCVARDDRVQPRIRDDLAVEWYPPVESRHTIEVVNFGGEVNAFELAVK